ncbi:MAG TPA: RNA polymerase sigma factor [Candidatus Limnocylindria bacterium]|nr:RNA polymerase sigma factor [Candidatus Limnocylindria bacterium]
MSHVADLSRDEGQSRGHALADARPVTAGPVDLEAAFERARPRLLAIGRSLVGAGGAEDVVQDTYLVARERIGQLRDPAAVEAWLARIAIHRCYRQRQRRMHLDRLLPWLHRTPSSSSLELRELIERLPVRERTVLVLHYGHGYSLGEIGQLLEITHVNARAIISRARRRLVTAWLESES